MRACIIQPPYSADLNRSDEYFAYKLKKLDECDSSVDIIVLPECSDVPCVTTTWEETLYYHNKYFDILMDKCVNTAKRCGANVFVNAMSKDEDGYKNTTYCYDKTGTLIGKYFKKHLPPVEVNVLKLAADYTYIPSEPYVLEIDGLRYGFLTCYDFYFYEAFARIARENIDILIGCSLQRSDTHEAIEIMCRFLAYNTNAYILRSSVSFGEDYPLCGTSIAVSPTGEILADMKGKIGKMYVDFDPMVKYLKPAGFGNPPAPHYEYIEWGRMPWQYRPAGSAIILDDDRLPYPRVCAHRGFSTVAPENSMPAFGAAVAMNAEEIEFDIWPTKDGEIVSCHDDKLERVSTGIGKIYEHTYDELKELDFGVKFGERFKGLRIVLFEDILKKFACHTIMNIHVKTLSDQYDENLMKKIVALIRKYDCTKHCYFMISHDGVIKQFKEYAPDIKMCVGHLGSRPWEIVERAIKFGAEKVQLYKSGSKGIRYFNKEMVEKAHANGIICNVFWSDDPVETREYLDMGIDTILTNDYNLITQVVERRISGGIISAEE